MLKRLFRPRPAREAGQRLYTVASAQARNPVFYRSFGVPDTPEGRFELYTLHVLLVLHRLKAQGPRATETGQGLFDAFLRSLDDGLREMGVGDLSVGKKMRKLGEAIYGRVKNFDAALARLPDEEPLRALIARTVYAGAETAHAGELAAYAARSAAALAEQDLAQLLEGHLHWPE